MITLQLTRQKTEAKAIRGSIALNETSLAFPTLENADFLIPAGTYPLRLTYSPRFRKTLPLVDSVPKRSGIRIHTGTKPEHSRGCILVNPAALQAIINLLINYSYEKIQLTIL